MKFEKLFETGQIGSMKLRGRVVMPAMTTLLAHVNGEISEKQIRYYAGRAAGGAALIIFESCCVDSRAGRSRLNETRIDDDSHIAGHSELAEAVHQYGAKLALQLRHVGWRVSIREAEREQQPVSPSGIAMKGERWRPRELSTAEVEELVEKFILAAGRARVAGYDAVEIHGAHDYLVHNFMSPHTNRRTDRYGGSTENRLRFALEIVRGIKQRVGSDFPVIFRFTAEETRDGGYTLEEGKTCARLLESAGVDALNVSMGVAGAEERGGVAISTSPMSFPQGWMVPYAEAIKRVVNIPVITVGLIREPAFAEGVLRGGKADFVALGRALIADPEWPKKVAEGRLEDIRLCISCNYCHDRVGKFTPLRCAINPDAGRWEGIDELKPALVPKRVVVVGGGPAGMEASLVAAWRGHKVSLYEKQESLGGGQLRLATTPPGKQSLKWVTDYLSTQLRKQKVDVHLGTEVSPQIIKEAKPDVVIMATGARPLLPDIAGIHNKNVVTAHDVLAGKVEIRGEKVVIIGGGQVGCETALFLDERDNKVTIVEQLPKAELARGAFTNNRADILARISRAGIETLAEHNVKQISDRRMVIADKNGMERSLKLDRVVVAAGAVPVRELADQLEGKVPELYIIGDSNEPRNIASAIYDGALIARKI